jgi:hypothetical protein
MGRPSTGGWCFDQVVCDARDEFKRGAVASRAERISISIEFGDAEIRAIRALDADSSAGRRDLPGVFANR